MGAKARMRRDALWLMVAGLVLALIQSPLSFTSITPWVQNTIRWGVRFLVMAAFGAALFYVVGWVYLTVQERRSGGIKEAKERMTRDALWLLGIGLLFALVQAPLNWVDIVPWLENTVRWGLRFLSLAFFGVGMLHLAARVYLGVLLHLGGKK